MNIEIYNNVLSILLLKRPFLKNRINGPLELEYVHNEIRSIYNYDGVLNPIFSIYTVFNGFAIDRNLQVPSRNWELFPNFVFFDLLETISEIKEDYCGYGFLSNGVFPMFTDGDIGYICFDIINEKDPVILKNSLMGDDLIIFDSSEKFLESIDFYYKDLDYLSVLHGGRDLYIDKMKSMNPNSNYWDSIT
jgi:hypothetical protein